jgi:toxin ParE1/3/4
MLRRLLQTIGTIVEFPRMGRSREELGPGIRSIPENPYMIFYQLTDEGTLIVRILHQSQNLDDIFDE